MSSQDDDIVARQREQWRSFFANPPPRVLSALRRIMRVIPSSPRCKLCNSPFRGVGGRVVRLAGFARSRKNPSFCNSCFDKAPHGGIELEIGVLFADIRGFTSASEKRTAAETTAVLNRFYSAATEVLVGEDAIIDKLVGDEVMALFIPFFAGADFMGKMTRSADAILSAVGYGSDADAWLPLGIGMDAGVAFVGNVGAGEIKDFTAIGDVVNTAARLQAVAQAGQIVMSERVYESAGKGYDVEAASVELQVKGKAEPVVARIIDRKLSIAARS